MSVLFRNTMALLFVAGALLLAFPAVACPPDYPPEYDRAQSAEHIFVGRVLDAEVIERGEQNGKAVQLLQLSVYVEDSLKGSAPAAELTTVFVVVPDTEPKTENAGEEAGVAEVAVAMDTYGGYYNENLPSSPNTLSSYVFFARNFDEGSFVLVANSEWYIESASDSVVESTRNFVTSPYGYY